VKEPSPRLVLVKAAVEVVSRDDRGTALRVLVSGTVLGVVAALDAGTRTTRLDELNVVLVAQANTTTGISLSAGASTGVVLASCIVRVQSAEFLGADAPGKLGVASSAGSLSGFELDIPPEVGRKLALLRGVPAGW